MTKSRQLTKGQKIFIIMAIFVCGLLFYANGVAFNLISAPTYVNDIIAFSALAVAVALTAITLTIVIRDKRRSLYIKTFKSNVVNSSKESIEAPITIFSPVNSQESTNKVEPNPAIIQPTKESDNAPIPVLPKANSSKRRNLSALMIVVAVGLLFYSIGVAFGLIPLPEYTMYAAVSGAAVLAIIPLALSLINKRRGAASTNHATQIIDASKKLNEIPYIIPSTVAAQETIKTSNKTPPPILFPVNIKSNTDGTELDTAEQEKQPTKQFIIRPTKLICPACRKEFELPIYLGDLIVDFGPPKLSNVIRPCPECGTLIALKKRDALEDEENFWKNNV